MSSNSRVEEVRQAMERIIAANNGKVLDSIAAADGQLYDLVPYEDNASSLRNLREVFDDPYVGCFLLNSFPRTDAGYKEKLASTIRNGELYGITNWQIVRHGDKEATAGIFGINYLDTEKTKVSILIASSAKGVIREIQNRITPIIFNDLGFDRYYAFTFSYNIYCHAHFLAAGFVLDSINTEILDQVYDEYRIVFVLTREKYEAMKREEGAYHLGKIDRRYLENPHLIHPKARSLSDAVESMKRNGVDPEKIRVCEKALAAVRDGTSTFLSGRGESQKAKLIVSF